MRIRVMRYSHYLITMAGNNYSHPKSLNWLDTLIMITHHVFDTLCIILWNIFNNFNDTAKNISEHVPLTYITGLTVKYQDAQPRRQTHADIFKIPW